MKSLAIDPRRIEQRHLTLLSGDSDVFARISVSFFDVGSHRRPLPNECVSYLDNGVQVMCAWKNVDSVQVACDAERLDTCVRPAVVNRHGFSDDPEIFATQWTRAEVLAKLQEVPILLWLRDPAEPLDTRTATFCITEKQVVVTAGWRHKIRYEPFALGCRDESVTPPS